MSLGLLAVAEPEGYVRTFADEGAAMRDLLSEVFKVRQRSGLEAANRVEGRYLAKILAALPRDATAQLARGPLDEPPSQRELEVLALIAAGETNGEIANRLFVSTSTVKTHINNLYRKLGARGRLPPDAGPRIEWVDATPGAPSRCPLSARAYTLADIYAQPLHVAVASPRPSGRRRAATRPRVRSIQDLGYGLRRIALPRTPVNIVHSGR